MQWTKLAVREIGHQLSCLCLGHRLPWQHGKFPETLRRVSVTHSAPLRRWSSSLREGGNKAGCWNQSCPLFVARERKCRWSGENGFPGLSGWKRSQGSASLFFSSPSLSLSRCPTKRWDLGVECVSQAEEHWKRSAWGKREGYPVSILHGWITGSRTWLSLTHVCHKLPHPKPPTALLTTWGREGKRPDGF